MELTSEQERALVSLRAAYLASHVDHQVLAKKEMLGDLASVVELGSAHSEPLTLEAFRSYAESVWAAEGRSEHLMVTAVEKLPPRVQHREFENAAAAARWFTVPNWTGRRRAGRSGARAFNGHEYEGPRLVAYIDSKEEGLRRLVALHEIAHLLIDTETVLCGHEPRWRQTYMRLQKTYLSVPLAVLWSVEFDWWSKKAEEKIAADPAWMAHLLMP